jgi:hypothetical protein
MWASGRFVSRRAEHVYSIALELGAEIRLNRPLDRITSLLDDLLDTPVA